MNVQDKPNALVPQSVTCGRFPARKRSIIVHKASPTSSFRSAKSRSTLPPMSRRSGSMTLRPYTDLEARIDLTQGLARIREPWLSRRQGLETYAGRMVRRRIMALSGLIALCALPRQ